MSRLLHRDLVFLILQFLDEENLKESVHTLERESGHFFNFKYFEEKALFGEWDEVDKYLSGFTKVDDNLFSMKLFLEIRRQKYLEALDRNDKEKAVEILATDLQVFETCNEEHYKELAQLTTLENIKENEHFLKYGDIKSARGIIIGELRKLMEANPLLREKLAIPTIEASRLKHLINQSVDWQHMQCKNPRPNPYVKTLFTNHICLPQNEARAPTPTGIDAMIRTTEKENVESVEENQPSELMVMEIISPAQCRQVMIQSSASKVARLLYTNSGDGVLALGTDGVQRLWKWSPSEENPTGKASASVTPQEWQPNSGLLMINDVPENPDETVPCISLSNNDSFVISACGGEASLFNMRSFNVMSSFMPPPPASTCLLFNPQDNNIAAIGMKDATIIIYYLRADRVNQMLKGHQGHITGLAFSEALNILVSSSADAQLCVWSCESWERKKSSVIQPPAVGDTRVQFHNDQVHLLVSHETQIAIYDVLMLECILKWVPQESISSPITCASYSCNSQLVYASFADGNIGVFDAEYLSLRCRIAPSAYMHQPQPNSAPIMPLVITAHPQKPNQIAVGLSDGTFIVLETPEAFKRWGVAGTGSGPSSCASATDNFGA